MSGRGGSRSTRYVMAVLREGDTGLFMAQLFGPFFSEAQAQSKADEFNARQDAVGGDLVASVRPMEGLRVLRDLMPKLPG